MIAGGGDIVSRGPEAADHDGILARCQQALDARAERLQDLVLAGLDLRPVRRGSRRHINAHLRRVPDVVQQLG